MTEATAVHPTGAAAAAHPPTVPLAPIKRVQARFNPLADGMLYLVVFVGGFFGTGMRYGLSLLIPNPAAPSGLFHSFHTATFVANMAACLIFATVTAYLSQAVWVRKRTRQLIGRGVGMGMCGGFSTLSAMMIEDLASLRGGDLAGFVLYTLLSFACGLLVTWMGTMAGLALSSRREAREVARAVADSAAAGRSGARGGHRAPAGRHADSAAEPSVSAVSAAQTGGDVAAEDGTVAPPSFEPRPITAEIPQTPDPDTGEVR